jgi:hypothetical protein
MSFLVADELCGDEMSLWWRDEFDAENEMSAMWRA